MSGHPVFAHTLRRRMPALRKLGRPGFISLVMVTVAITCFARRGYPLTVFGDVFGLVLLLLTTAVTLRNALTQQRARAFWALLSAGCFMWAINQWGWTWIEVIQRRELPDPFVGDVILFVHVVPFMAAV